MDPGRQRPSAGRDLRSGAIAVTRRVSRPGESGPLLNNTGVEQRLDRTTLVSGPPWARSGDGRDLRDAVSLRPRWSQDEASVSEDTEVEPAVDVDHLAGGEREGTRGQGRHGTADVLGQSPPPDRARAPRRSARCRRNEPAGSCRCRSIRGGPRRPGSLLRKPDGEELGDHAQPGLGHAVFGAIDAGESAGDRRDEDDLRVRDDPRRIRSSIAAATAWVRKKGPLRLVARTRSQLSAVVSSRSTRVRGATPALLTQRSTRPNRSRAWSSRRRPSREVGHVGLHGQARRAPGASASRQHSGPRRRPIDS